MADKPEYADRSSRYTLRPIEAADDSRIAAILTQTYAAAEPEVAAQLLRPAALPALSTEYSIPRAAYFVVTQAMNVVGGAGLAPLTGARSEVCELRDLCMLPQARGHGVATDLVEHCLAVALAFGYRHCYAELVQSMRPAASVLERLGFSRLNQPVGDTGRFLCDRWYLRDL